MSLFLIKSYKIKEEQNQRNISRGKMELRLQAIMSSWLSSLYGLNVKVYVYVFCLLLPFVSLPLALSQYTETRCGYVLILLTAYWILEPVPITVTALLPTVFFPMLGVVSSDEICASYIKEMSMLLLGVLILALATEECKVHERIALKVLLTVGTEIKWLMMGFMLSTMLFSMWCGNTASAAAMVPILEAILNQISNNDIQENVKNTVQGNNTNVCEIELKSVKDEASSNVNSEHRTQVTLPQNNESTSSKPSQIKIAFLLSISYSAVIGGTGTLFGSGSNIVFAEFMEQSYPDSNEVTFISWMLYNIPAMVLCLSIGWVYLWLLYIRTSKEFHILGAKETIRKIISKRYTNLGPITFHETAVLILFGIAICLLVFRDPKFVPGWASINFGTSVGNSMATMAVVFLLFLIPRNLNKFGRPLLEWKAVQEKLPWGIILLLGGGFAIAVAVKKSGLSMLMSQELSRLQFLPPLALLTIVCILTAAVTEAVNNATAAIILLPVLNSMALSMQMNPLYLMLPAAVACNFAFMLPVATPPNAIVFDSGGMTVMDMAKPGFFMNLVCCAVQLVMLNTLGVAMFDLNTFPSWANVTNTDQ